MTQMELADRLNISFQAVSNWERGNSMPDISKLPELAELFGISIDELLGKKSELISNIMREIWRSFRKYAGSCRRIEGWLPLFYSRLRLKELWRMQSRNLNWEK